MLVCLQSAPEQGPFAIPLQREFQPWRAVCRAGLKQPTVDVRFEKLNASAMAPAGSSDGLFTVGVDLQACSHLLLCMCQSFLRFFPA